jgi:hypothetical protein
MWRVRRRRAAQARSVSIAASSRQLVATRGSTQHLRIPEDMRQLELRNEYGGPMSCVGQNAVLITCALALSGTRPKQPRIWRSTAFHSTKPAPFSTIRYHEQLTTQIILPKKRVSSRWACRIAETSLWCATVTGQRPFAFSVRGMRNQRSGEDMNLIPIESAK